MKSNGKNPEGTFIPGGEKKQNTLSVREKCKASGRIRKKIIRVTEKWRKKLKGRDEQEVRSGGGNFMHEKRQRSFLDMKQHF